MLRLVLLILVLASPVAAKPTESLRQYTAETSTDVSRIVETLSQRLPESVALLELGGEVALSYTGNATPPALSGFLETAFQDLDPAVIAMGQTVSLTLTLANTDAGTIMSLMLMARFPSGGQPIMDGAVVMLDGRGAGTCAGQLVLQQPALPEAAAPAYVEHLENEGFAFEPYDPQETSFFIGHRPGCALALYLQEDQGASLIVIRYLED